MEPEQLDRPRAVPVGIDAASPPVDVHVEGVRYVLGQMRDVVVLLDAGCYTRKNAGGFGGSIGAHVRHCLDHIEALVCGAVAGVIDYDHRDRGTDIETSPGDAIVEIDRIDMQLRALPRDFAGHDVEVCVMLGADGDVARLRSTVARELAFVFSHTIHHGAMIGGMVRALGGDVPEGFGLAPSTIAYRKS